MGGDQASTLRRIGRQPGDQGAQRSLRKRRFIAVTGGKGGVGKSTVAVNLAATYACRGARTVLVDGDLGMADLNLLLGLAPERSVLDLLHGVSLDEVLVEAHGMHLLPGLNGSHRLANLDASGRQQIVSAINDLTTRFETVVVDTPSGIGDNVLTLAASAVDVIVVTTPEPLALADAYACMKVLATRRGIERIFLIPNEVRSPSQAEEVLGRLQSLVDRFLGITVIPLPAIPYDPAVVVAGSCGVPVVLHSADSPVSRAFQRATLRFDALSDENDVQALRRPPLKAAAGSESDI